MAQFRVLVRSPSSLPRRAANADVSVTDKAGEDFNGTGQPTSRRIRAALGRLGVPESQPSSEIQPCEERGNA